MGERAIAAVSSALREILASALAAEPPLVEREDYIVLASPTEMPRDRHARLGVFLYRVNQHVLSRPEAMEIRGPLGLVLSYMLVPIGPDAELSQAILGRVLRTLHQHTKLEVPEAGGKVELRLLTHPLDEPLKLWTALGTPYSCALYYDVRIVQVLGS